MVGVGVLVMEVGMCVCVFCMKVVSAECCIVTEMLRKTTKEMETVKVKSRAGRNK